MLFRQLFDTTSSTYTYLIADEVSKEALIIDSVLEKVDRDFTLIQELGLNLKYTLETHIHADHVTGAAALKQLTGAEITTPNDPEVKGCDRRLLDGDTLLLGEGIQVQTIECSGHTGFDNCYLVNETHLFTGDALFIRGCGRTDFQSGDPARLYQGINKKLFTLDDKVLVYPAHDYNGRTVSTIGEEKRFNPRLAQKNEAEFIAIMESLHLPKPKLIDIALPRNQQCGSES